MYSINPARVALIARERIASSIFGALVLLALIPGSASAGSQIFVSGSATLETDYWVDPTGPTLIMNSFSYGLSSYVTNSFDNRGFFNGMVVQTAMEFDLSSLHGPVQSAIVSLYVSNAFVGDSQVGSPMASDWPAVLGIEVSAGSGIQQSDFNGASYGGVSFNSSTNFPSFIYPVNLDVTGFVNSPIENSDRYLEIVLSAPDIIISTGPVTFDFATQPFLQPTLTINAPAPFSNPISVGISSVPEPSSCLMLASGTVGLALLHVTRRRRSPH